MTACFHLPSVVCENCAHLRSSVRPETRTFVTNHLIVAPDSGPTKASSGYNPPLDGTILYTRQQIEAMLRTALTDRTPEWTSKTVDERVETLLTPTAAPSVSSGKQRRARRRTRV